MMAAVPPAQGGIQILGKMAIQTVLSLHASRDTMATATDSDDASHTAPIHEDYLKNLSDRGCSFTASAEREIARDGKENLSYISSDYDAVHKSIAEFDKKKTYELPDRKHHLCRRRAFPLRGTSIHETFFQYIMKCDVYIRKDLYDNVVLPGGTNMFQGMVEHMTKERTALLHPR